MGNLGPGVVVLVRFPFSDLSPSKLRPALVVARAGVTDWALCQITSHRYGDPLSVAITKHSFETGGLERDTFCSTRQAIHGQRGHGYGVCFQWTVDQVRAQQGGEPDKVRRRALRVNAGG